MNVLKNKLNVLFKNFKKWLISNQRQFACTKIPRRSNKLISTILQKSLNKRRNFLHLPHLLKNSLIRWLLETDSEETIRKPNHKLKWQMKWNLISPKLITREPYNYLTKKTTITSKNILCLLNNYPLISINCHS